MSIENNPHLNAYQLAMAHVYAELKAAPIDELGAEARKLLHVLDRELANYRRQAVEEKS